MLGCNSSERLAESFNLGRRYRAAAKIMAASMDTVLMMVRERFIRKIFINFVFAKLVKFSENKKTIQNHYSRNFLNDYGCDFVA